jgi:peptide/nickel transport system substrate-binding protein
LIRAPPTLPAQTVTATVTETATGVVPPATTVATIAAMYGGTLVTQLTDEPATLNPMTSVHAATEFVGAQVYETLIQRDLDMNLSPGLAKSWDRSSDGKTYIMELQPNAVWHDGEPFTSDDVVFTYTQVAPKNFPYYDAYFGLIKSVEAPGKHTVVFNLKAQNPDLLTYFADIGGGVPIPRHLYEGTDVMKSPYNMNPIGTGPFKMSEWKKATSITVVKNPDYFVQGRPYLDKIVTVFIYDASAAVAAFQAGQVQALWGMQEPSMIPTVEKVPGATVAILPTPAQPYYKLQFNLRDPILKIKEVRQALYHASNIAEIFEKVFYNTGILSTGPISPGSFTKKYYTNDVKHYPYDPGTANQLLDGAGFTKKGDGMRFKLECLIPASGAMFIKECEILRDQWSKVGVDLVNTAEEDMLFLQHVYMDWKFQLNPIWEYGGPTVGPAIGMLHSRNIIKSYFTNNMGYSNPRVDELLDEQASETDDAKRIAEVQEIQKIVMEDPPEMYMFTLNGIYPYYTKFHNMPPSPGTPPENWENVWMEQ